MTFKEMVLQDIKEVFLNFDEMGTMHEVAGREMLIIIDELELTNREKRIRETERGLHKKQLLIYVAGEDFGPLPAPGFLMSLDGKQYLIRDAADEDGIYSIELEANKS